MESLEPSEPSDSSDPPTPPPEASLHQPYRHNPASSIAEVTRRHCRERLLVVPLF